jgi:hypothetical protein
MAQDGDITAVFEDIDKNYTIIKSLSNKWISIWRDQQFKPILISESDYFKIQVEELKEYQKSKITSNDTIIAQVVLVLNGFF